jgi:superfamily I DNA/RNA helicase
MSGWLLPFSDLTLDQRRIVEAPPDQHRLVMGFPGSGKTQILVHRADFLRKMLASPPDRYRVMIFTNVLRDYIRSGLDLLGLPLASVCTFDSWCNGFYRAHVGRRVPSSAESDGQGFEQTHAAVLQYLRTNRSSWGQLDFALVDEAQDLRPECFEILRLAAKHVTAFADPQQQIYEEGASLDRIRENLGIARAQTALLEAYRNSPDVTALAAFFIGDDERRAQYLRQSRFRLCERERPLYFAAPSEEAEYDRLAEAVKGRQVLNQRVGILMARNQLVHRVASALDRRGVPVERAVPQTKCAGGSGGATFGNGIPKVATFHSAKGLTFDAVCMPRLNEEAFVRFRGAQRRRILFVGIARAIQWVYLSAVDGEPFEEMSLFQAAAATGKLVIQKAGAACVPTPSVGGDDFSVL